MAKWFEMILRLIEQLKCRRSEELKVRDETNTNRPFGAAHFYSQP